MASGLFTARLDEVRKASLRYFTDRFGRNGLKEWDEISPLINWKPAYHFKPTTSRIIAVEIDDNLDPPILRLSTRDIIRFDHPIEVYLGCPLEVFQADPRQEKIKALKRNGIGIITVDDQGNPHVQHHTVPLAQHITEEELVREIKGLPQKLRSSFRSAHTTFSTNVGQGLQEAGQIVEALIECLKAGALRDGIITKTAIGKTTADAIDNLFPLPHFKQFRAALGSARAFVSHFRNTASHPAKTAKAASEKIRKCRDGFFEGIRCAKDLLPALKNRKCKIAIHT